MTTNVFKLKAEQVQNHFLPVYTRNGSEPVRFNRGTTVHFYNSEEDAISAIESAYAAGNFQIITNIDEKKMKDIKYFLSPEVEIIVD